MRLSDFDYDLSEKLIAQYPLKKRDEAKLMIVNRATSKITHDHFFNLNCYLPKKSMLVLNDSKVVPARLFGRKEFGGREVEVFLLKKLSDGYCYETLMRPLRKIKDNEKILFDGTTLWAKLVDREKMIVRFNRKEVMPYLKKIGHIPLPPYIKRSDEKSDQINYQTVYAKRQGSVAAPTAGLHFTDRLLNGLKESGHSIKRVTLHVNYGTFRPIEEDDVVSHKMHKEDFLVSKGTWDSILRSKKHNKKVVAVGTTSCRVLETVAKKGKFKGASDLFIYPGFQFRVVDALLTNFHLPKSTLLMLVCGFATRDLIMHAYHEAIKEKYRFYSYGDCMLIV
ncbi:MAG: tRNA preQ1(34) S-adenosylmethionine ribosyltransferase-isomerase QueA [Candidatus Omnitrophica bacterium]|nr:tRNA preQ1(34) S-adenosylmethionine ribosyltransferase-isomerase QueA [Candidatus Omnitrophota bacterium]